MKPDLAQLGKPHDLRAEQNVIGSMLLSPAACDEVSLLLTPQDFYDPRNECLFETILSVHNRGQPIDETILLARLRKAKLLKQDPRDEGRGVDVLHLAEAVHSVPTAANAAYYGRLVQEKSIQRSLLTVAEQTAEDVHAFHGDSDALLERAERRVMEVGDRRVSSRAVPIQVVMWMSWPQACMTPDSSPDQAMSRAVEA